MVAGQSGGAQPVAVHPRRFARQTGEPIVYERLLCPLGRVRRDGARLPRGRRQRLQRDDALQVRGLRARATGAASARAHGRRLQHAALRRRRLVRRQHRRRRAGARHRAQRRSRDCAARACCWSAPAAARPARSGRCRGAARARSSSPTGRVARAEALVARHLRRSVPSCTRASRRRRSTAAAAAFDVVVNASASSVSGSPVPVAGSVLKRGALAVDMMYGAAAASLSRLGRSEHGARGRDGLGMLVEQAAEAFLLWRGVRPPNGARCSRALRARLEGQ